LLLVEKLMPTKKFLDGQVALVTGAGVRVGRAIALALAEHGATVAVHYNDSESEAKRVAALIRQKGGKGELFQADLSDDVQRAELIPQIQRTLGNVHILINSAALFGDAHFADTTLKEWDDNFNVNLKAPFHLSQCFAAQRGGKIRGNIINISDWRGLRPGEDHFAYTITKAALIKMTEAMALALAPRIRVNSLALGSILPPPGATKGKIKELVEATPLKQMGSPQDVIAAILFLLGPGCYITGENIVVDGGRRLVT
jgi:pteridine reductase